MDYNKPLNIYIYGMIIESYTATRDFTSRMRRIWIIVGLMILTLRMRTFIASMVLIMEWINTLIRVPYLFTPPL
jgi:hypothetical protein